MLTREGRIGREFFLILSGTVAVTQKGRQRQCPRPRRFLRGACRHEPRPRNATVTALSDLDVLIIGPREFAAMADIPGVRDALLESMARRLRAVDAAWRRHGQLEAPSDPAHVIQHDEVPFGAVPAATATARADRVR